MRQPGKLGNIGDDALALQRAVKGNQEAPDRLWRGQCSAWNDHRSSRGGGSVRFQRGKNGFLRRAEPLLCFASHFFRDPVCLCLHFPVVVAFTRDPR